MTARPPFGVAVPIRAFSVGSTRLAGALDDETRTALAMRLAARVVQAAGSAPVVVVSDAPEVVEWAHACGATVVTDPGSLDAAAAAGQASLAARGCVRAVIAH